VDVGVGADQDKVDNEADELIHKSEKHGRGS
jgi:hypothetical protein